MPAYVSAHAITASALKMFCCRLKTSMGADVANKARVVAMAKAVTIDLSMRECMDRI